MNVWTIRLLGTPVAFCGDQQARLRSKETWAVLASLLLPSVLRREAPTLLGRTALATRFWGGSEVVEPRTHLRQCLASLRAAFGDDCLIADRQDVRVAPGWFTTDLDHLFTMQRKAQAASTLEERLHWLMEAEREMRGEFLEGWTPDSNEGELWLLQTRADLHTRLLFLLLLLPETLQAVGNPAAAFDAALRALQFQPDHPQAKQKARELAALTGRQSVLQTLEDVQSFRDALKKYPDKGLKIATLSDRRALQTWFEADLRTLPADHQKALAKLAIFPSPFPTEMAETVCKVSLPVLQELAKTHFLQQTADTFCLPPMVRDCAWERLTLSTRLRLRRRLARFCIAALAYSPTPVNVLPSPLGPAERGRPFLLLTLEWLLEQLPTWPHVCFINMLRFCGLNDLAMQGVAYLQKIEANASFPVEMRLDAGVKASYILMQADENAAATSILETGMSLAEATDAQDWFANYYSTLTQAYSRIGAWDAARQTGLQALEVCRRTEHRQGETHSIRVLAEIALGAGEPEQALLLCEEAQELACHLPPESDCIPDALYWKARILCHLRRWEEAAHAIEAALSLWQDAGDTKIGLCLCVLGQIHREKGRYAEARMHLEHAIDLHRRSAREGFRIAAAEALADLFRTLHRDAEARALYAECLAYYQSKTHGAAIERLSTKIEA